MYREVPPYTTSIDAAMTLVPDGMILRNYTASRFVPHTCEVAVDWAHGGFIGHSDHSLPLALCAAALRARKDG
jgi:membrane protein involved in colicin uptake